MRRSLPWSVGDQQPVASVMRRWRKSPFHLEYPRLCFLRVPPAGMIGAFGGNPRTRHLLKRRWRHCGIRMGGPLKISERQAEHVGHVPSYFGRTSALCRRLGRRTSIRRSLLNKKLRCSRLEEVPAEAEAGRSPQSGRDGATDTEGPF
ncbi:hypothetical protein TcBrA4_0101460 [Trypanosoma cruzi]|nr:hypothetical protein TcBrA4_0101460 [Trypanosoma cruzi]